MLLSTVDNSSNGITYVNFMLCKKNKLIFFPLVNDLRTQAFSTHMPSIFRTILSIFFYSEPMNLKQVPPGAKYSQRARSQRRVN